MERTAPAYVPPAPPAPAYNWTGFCVGVNGGFGGNKTEILVSCRPYYREYSVTSSGWFGAPGQTAGVYGCKINPGKVSVADCALISIRAGIRAIGLISVASEIPKVIRQRSGKLQAEKWTGRLLP